LLWILGSSIWMISEYIWSFPVPCGFLERLSFVEDLPRRDNLLMLISSVLVHGSALFMLVIFYIGFMLFARQRALPQDLETGFSLPVIFNMPLCRYRCLWWAPWLVMEFCWVVCDTMLATGGHVHYAPWLRMGVLGGILSMTLCVDCSRRLVAAEQYREAVLNSAEFFWILGNFVWTINDVVSGGQECRAGQIFTATAFSLGFGMTVIGLCITADNERTPLTSVDRRSVTWSDKMEAKRSWIGLGSFHDNPSVPL